MTVVEPEESEFDDTDMLAEEAGEVVDVVSAGDRGHDVAWEARLLFFFFAICVSE